MVLLLLKCLVLWLWILRLPQVVDCLLMLMLPKTTAGVGEKFISTRNPWLLKDKVAQVAIRQCITHPLQDLLNTSQLQRNLWMGLRVPFSAGYPRWVVPNKHLAPQPRQGKFKIKLFYSFYLNYIFPFNFRSAAWSTATPGYSNYEGISPSRSPGNASIAYLK